MQKQNFEKRVQQKMEELSFTPSDPVWQKIEAGLKKKRERRRLLLWLLPFMLALGGGVWWSVNSNSSHIQTSKAYAVKNERKEQQQLQQSQASNNPASIRIEKKHRINKQILQTDNANGSDKTTLNKLATASIASTKNQTINQINNTLSPIASKKNLRLAYKKEKTANTATNNTNNTFTNKPGKESPSVSSNQTFSSPDKSDTQHVKDADSLFENKKEIKDSVALAIVKAPSPQIHLHHKKVWEWNIYTAFGFSRVSSRLFTFDKLFSGRFDAVAAQNYTSGGSYYLPSLNKSGVSFSVGVNARRKIIGKLSLTTGLQYSFYSTYNSVGQKVIDTFYIAGPVASTANNIVKSSANLITYYKNDLQLNNYRNEYHFIELPIGLEYHFFKKAPLRLQAGVSITQLIRSSALQYNNSLNVYYEDNSVIHKTGFGLFSNLAYRIWQNKKLSLFAGPQLRYGLSNLQKSEAGKQHLFFAGLKTNISFK